MKKIVYSYDGGYRDFETNHPISWTNLKDIETGNYILIVGRCHAYYVKYQIHREDGPAKIWYDEDGIKIIAVECWLNNVYYRTEEFMKRISKENRIKFLFSLGEYFETT